MKNRIPDKRQKKTGGDEALNPPRSALPEAVMLIILTLSIIIFGLVMLYSTSFVTFGTSYLMKQIMWVGVGAVAACGVVFLFGYKTLSDYSWLLMLLCLGLLGAALCFRPIKGAHRWLILGPFSIQPSEFAKVVLVLFLAKYYALRAREAEARPLITFMIGGMGCALLILFVLLGKDLGTTTLLICVFLAMSLIAGISWYWIAGPVLIGVPAVIFAIFQFDPERTSRLTSFLDPEMCQKGDGYQLWNSLLALGSGDWFGIGFTESRLKMKYLPEAHTDFILAIAGEELGFVALLAVIAVYILFAFVGIRIGCMARTRQGMLVAFGMVMFITMQAIINMSVISAAFPTKGMPAPMISYGGSNMVACLLAVACICSVALDNTYPDYADGIRGKLLGRFKKKK